MKQELQQATHVLRKDMGGVGKRHSRIHDDTAGDNVQRLRAIGGVCGSCENLKIEFTHQDGRERVALKCLEGFSPLGLHRETEFGEEATCSGLSKKVE